MKWVVREQSDADFFFSVFNGRMVFIILFSRKNSSKEQANESNVYSVSVNPTLDEKATFAPLSSGDHGKVKWRESGKTEVEHWEVMVIGTRGEKNHSAFLLCSFPHSTKL